jgi:hypothetical protein
MERTIQKEILHAIQIDAVLALAFSNIVCGRFGQNSVCAVSAAV